MQGFFFLFFLFITSLSFLTTISTSTITDTLTSSQILLTNQTLESSNQTFVLGFIPGTNSNKIYLAIWYKNIDDTIVWVANRDNPLQNSTNSYLKIGDNGNIVLLNSSSDSDNNLVWSSNQTKAANPLVLQLLDNGNLVLRETNVNDPTKYLWQSFDYPTDTLLPSMNIGWNFDKNTEKHLTSWKITGEDPSTGHYSFKIDYHGLPEIFLRKDDTIIYRSGPWNGERFSGVPEMQHDTDSIVFNFSSNEHGVNYSFSIGNPSIFSRLVVDSGGQLQRRTWVQSMKTWTNFWYAPKDQCDDYRECGPYGLCDTNASPVCQCVKGFSPKNEQAWKLRDGSDGCVRNKNLDCESDMFYHMENVKLPETTSVFVNKTMGIKECGDLCHRNCSCTGYANVYVTNGGSGCVMWIGELNDIRNYPDGGQDLFVRLAASELELLHAASSSRVIIKHGEFIRDKEGEVLVSDGFNFVMGFFGFQNSSSRYVGIWYYNIPGPEVIWVANRNKPINGNGGSFTVSTNGNLVILDGNKNQLWSTNVSIIHSNKNNSEAVLGDDGNLVLLNEKVVLWESFENLSDTYVPGMKVPVNGKRKSSFFTSWKSSTDPSLGNHIMGVDPAGLPPQIVVWEGERRTWRSGYWDGRIFTGVDMTGSFLHGFILNYDNNGDRYFVYNDNELKWNYNSSVRFKIGWDGIEREFIWKENEKRWIEIQKGPHNQCEVYNYCGGFAACELSVSGSAICSCLKGFELRDKGNLSGGCKRMTALKGDQRNGSFGEDGFLVRGSMKLPDFARVVDTKDCKGNCLENGSCTAYAEVIGIGCMVWYGDLVDILHFQHGEGNALHIRLAHSDLGDGGKNEKIMMMIILTVLAGLICIGIIVLLVWRYKRRLKASCCKNSDVLPVFDAHKSREMSAEIPGSVELGLEGNQLSKVELPFFNFSCMSAATNNFSEENKLGQGGFGPVYKGKLPSGEEIAVKRLSRRSGQGLDEFKNEMRLFAQLQHRNLVKLMGCSIEGDEKLLVYEFMPNKSLDRFLFDPIKQTQLDWARRYEIIEGIARGLLYLHRDSRLRIIHRDLKASNILLDENMNPKISDFGLARIFGGNQNEENTTKVVGTYGYMSPEYAMEGLFSVKSDVYSFGVLLLEIVSGRKNTSFRHSDDSNLIGYAWNLWNERRAMELLDPRIRDSSPTNKALRCIQIGMLCVQDSASHRPDMSKVVLLLESEATTLPIPTQPLITSMRRSEDREFYMDGLNVSNDLTVTMVVGR